MPHIYWNMKSHTNSLNNVIIFYATWHRSPSASWAALAGVLPVSQLRWSSTSAQRWWGHSWSAVPSSGLLSPRETWTYWRESRVGPQRQVRHWSIRRTERGCESWDSAGESAPGVHPRAEKAQGDLINVQKYLMGGNEEDGASLFSVVPTDRTRGSGHKLKHTTFHLSTRKHFVFCLLFLLLWGSSNTGTGCTARLWSFQPWRYSKPDWTRSWKTCSSWPCFVQEQVQPDKLQRSQWFCDSVSVNIKSDIDNRCFCFIFKPWSPK